MRIEGVPIVSDHTKVAETTTSEGTYRFVLKSIDNKLLRINEEAFKLLSLCDGSRSVLEILQIFSEEYEPSTTKPVVIKALSKLNKLGVVYFSIDKQSPRDVIVSSIRLSYPLNQVFLEITSQCNLKCSHCYGDFGSRSYDLTIDIWKKVIDQLAGLNVSEIILSGGEPLCHEDAFELISYIRKKPMHVVLSTNGTLIDEDVADKIKRLSVKSVRISLDGPNAQIHDTFRGVKGTYDKTIRAIQLLLERKVHVRINSCITKKNSRYLPEMQQLSKKLRVNEHNFFIVYFTGRRTNLITHAPFFSPNDREELEYIHKNLGVSVTAPEETGFSTESNSTINCNVGRAHLVIAPNGNVLPCLVFDREEFVLGNVKQRSIRDIWENSEMLNMLRAIDMRKTPECGICEYLPSCKGGCRARAYTFLRDLHKPDIFGCIAFRNTNVLIKKDTNLINPKV
jgi:radical SAM protein with 4Fe4S-binding SPASM domain